MRRYLIGMAVLIGSVSGCASSGTPAATVSGSPTPTPVHVVLTEDDRDVFTLGCYAVFTAGLDNGGPTPRPVKTRTDVVEAAGDFTQATDPDVKAVGSELEAANNPARWAPAITKASEFCTANGFKP